MTQCSKNSSALTLHSLFSEYEYEREAYINITLGCPSTTTTHHSYFIHIRYQHSSHTTLPIMRFTIATVATMAAAATASVLPRSDLGAWNVTLVHTGGNDRARTETVSGVYANSQLKNNIPVTCHFQGLLNGEEVDETTCDPPSFSYVLNDAGYDSASSEYLYSMCTPPNASLSSTRIDKLSALTLSQTVTLSGTNVTVKGESGKFATTGFEVTYKNYEVKDILAQASTGVA